MAEVIAAFDPEVPVEHDRQRKYPWDQWFDGQIWRLTPGVDFENHSLVIERQIRTRASARKVAVHIQHGYNLNFYGINALSVLIQWSNIELFLSSTVLLKQKPCKRIKDSCFSCGVLSFNTCLIREIHIKALNSLEILHM